MRIAGVVFLCLWADVIIEDVNVCLSFCLSLFLSFSLFLSLSHSSSLPFYLCLSFYLSLSFSLSLSCFHSLFLAFTLSLAFFLFLSFSLAFSFSFFLSLSLPSFKWAPSACWSSGTDYFRCAHPSSSWLICAALNVVLCLYLWACVCVLCWGLGWNSVGLIVVEPKKRKPYCGKTSERSSNKNVDPRTRILLTNMIVWDIRVFLVTNKTSRYEHLGYTYDINIRVFDLRYEYILSEKYKQYIDTYIVESRHTSISRYQFIWRNILIYVVESRHTNISRYE